MHAPLSTSGLYDLFFLMYNVKVPETTLHELPIMCQVFQSFTPALALVRGHNAEQIETTCRLDSKSFDFELPPTRSPTVVPLAPTAAPANVEMVQNSTTTTSLGGLDMGANETGSVKNNATSQQKFLLPGNVQALRNIPTDIINSNMSQHPKNIYKITSTIIMSWESASWNVSEYHRELEVYVNNNKETVQSELASLLYGNDTDAGRNLTIVRFHGGPWIEDVPLPPDKPSWEFTIEPTFQPTIRTRAPTVAITLQPSVMTPAPTQAGIAKGMIAVIVVVVISVLGTVGLLVLYWDRKQRPKETTKNNITIGKDVELNEADGLDSYGVATAELVNPSDIHKPPEAPRSFLAESESRLTNETHVGCMSTKGLLTGSIDGYTSNTQQHGYHNAHQKMCAVPVLAEIVKDCKSINDLDKVKAIKKTRKQPSLADIFEQFKDCNVEKMRTSLEDNLVGFGDMMSQAVTMALIMDCTLATIPIWHGAKTGVEIEANALWEVTEWLKRHIDPEFDDKQLYMQTLLNKMVSTVHMGIIGPEDASRAMHECAALLCLPLTNQLPGTAIIVSGMQKTTSTSDFYLAFKEFGPIDSIAMASDQRGFGIVRFKHQNAAAEVMERFRTSEIVIKNVAVTLKSLPPLDASNR